MTRFDVPRAVIAALAIAATSLLGACGQPTTSTDIVLTGPVDKVEALIARRELYAPPVQAHVEKLADGRERAAFSKPGGLPATELVELGKAAAQAGVNIEFTTGTRWNSGASSADVSSKAKPAPGGGPVV